ncbi:MAG: sugar transferase [Deltaproteobacteria bacterium]|nr:sugar transferase [Deltaproteobacteria bacterium]
MKPYQAVIKSAFDRVGALVGLITLSPLFLLIALAIKLETQGAALFRQTRMGKDGESFTFYKFRTMYVNAPDIRNSDGSTFNAENDPRVTRVGHLLRKTSLDELPQLFNILTGEMSFIGPRPDMPDQIRFYNERRRKRLLVKPGITGLAAISGRNSNPWEQRRELDVQYVENYSLGLDLKILLRTIPVVLFGRGVYMSPETIQRPSESRGFDS